jgi:cellulose synthase/poly-beta-1,6-N-acetylglucosamine synthase-like glycosyltransferase
VCGQWEKNEKAYWWHEGKRAHVRDLPPKKTRQLLYAFYSLCPDDGEDTLVSYIDADSAPPPNYFLLGAAGASKYDVVQLTNVAGNLLDSWASSFHAFDHMCWDGSIYAHMSAHGRHPFYVLGKGLFFRSSDLHAFGGFHPWLTIEDPEVGMRLWTNGKRLGVVRQPLIEEVPLTFGQGVTQRKRWICGFFQSLGEPLTRMGMTAGQRFRARLNLIPCLSLLVNPVGLGVGIWILALVVLAHRPLALPIEGLTEINILAAGGILAANWARTWRLSKAVLDRRSSRLHYFLRVNPLFVLVYWVFWIVSIVIGIQMFVRDKGLVWERTEKVDANHELVRGRENAVIEEGETRPGSERDEPRRGAATAAFGTVAPT